MDEIIEDMKNLNINQQESREAKINNIDNNNNFNKDSELNNDIDENININIEKEKENNINKDNINSPKPKAKSESQNFQGKLNIPLKTKRHFKLDDFEVISLSGKGAYGTVLKVKLKSEPSNKLYAVKIMDIKALTRIKKLYQAYLAL